MRLVASQEAEVVVVADPIVTLQPLGASYCQDAASVDELMIAVDGGTGTYSYQWFVSTTASNTAGVGDYWRYVFFVCPTG